MRESWGDGGYGPNVCVPPECVCRNPNSSVLALGGGVFGRRLGHEAGAFKNGVSVLR